ncbi:hypothetical protein V1460_35135 [Streptomyces sp. SCSIO 30461]|uniref:hypothetical protein n=1 Tax=Streptomyces sp. SCSIO 30461 TaxID=3118085 RepID=UPI0030D415BD
MAGLSAWTFLLMLVLGKWDPALGTFIAVWTPISLAAVAVLVHGGRRGRGRR